MPGRTGQIVQDRPVGPSVREGRPALGHRHVEMSRHDPAPIGHRPPRQAPGDGCVRLQGAQPHQEGRDDRFGGTRRPVGDLDG